MMFAYIDPSVMSYTVQAIAGVAIALGVVFGVVTGLTLRAVMPALLKFAPEKPGRNTKQ